MKNPYTELELQRQHLVGTEGKDREMVMCGINRLLDELLDSARPELSPDTPLEPSKEGQAHLEKGRE